MRARHRYVASGEHDPAQSLFDGCCAVCAEPWPCAHEKALQDAEMSLLTVQRRILEATAYTAAPAPAPAPAMREASVSILEDGFVAALERAERSDAREHAGHAAAEWIRAVAYGLVALVGSRRS